MSPALAWPRIHSHSATPVTASRISHRSAICPEPAQVKAIQVRCVRLRHLATVFASRASSRASPPKALTTALAPMASASTPPIRVSHWFDSRAVGASTCVARPTVRAM